jgi:hypothetical protein
MLPRKQSSSLLSSFPFIVALLQRAVIIIKHREYLKCISRCNNFMNVVAEKEKMFRLVVNFMSIISIVSTVNSPQNRERKERNKRHQPVIANSSQMR